MLIKNNLRQSKIQSNQEGIIAITVTLMIMLVLTLITTGFAQMARREQREALDRQLATQALYAAESGINDGQRIINDPSTPANYEKSSCAPEVGQPSSQLDTEISYSCLLIKQKLPNLIFETVRIDKSTVTTAIPESAAGHDFTKLVIAWQNSGESNANTVRSNNNFVPANQWTNQEVGVLRIDLVPIIDTGSPQTATTLRNGTFTAFLRPKLNFATGDGVVSYTASSSDQGKIVNANCTSAVARKCQVIVTGLAGSNYFLRMKGIYNPVNAFICAGSDVSTGCDENITLNDTQSEIDATGRANDVLKRLKVRVNKTPDYNGVHNRPEFSVDSSDSICKLYSLWPGGSSSGICP